MGVFEFYRKGKNDTIKCTIRSCNTIKNNL